MVRNRVMIAEQTFVQRAMADEINDLEATFDAELDSWLAAHGDEYSDGTSRDAAFKAHIGLSDREWSRVVFGVDGTLAKIIKERCAANEE